MDLLERFKKDFFQNRGRRSEIHRRIHFSTITVEVRPFNLPSKIEHGWSATTVYYKSIPLFKCLRHETFKFFKKAEIKLNCEGRVYEQFSEGLYNGGRGRVVKLFNIICACVWIGGSNLNRWES